MESVHSFTKFVLKIFLSNSDLQTLVLGERFGHDFLVKIRFQTFFDFFGGTYALPAEHMRKLLNF